MSRTTAFVRCCLNGLERMYVPDEHVFAFTTRWTPGGMVRGRDPRKELKFTMNALMGLWKAREDGCEIFMDVEKTLDLLARGMTSGSGTMRAGGAPLVGIEDPETFASLVWAAGEIGHRLPAGTMRAWNALLDDGLRSSRLTAQALAWALVAGSCGSEEARERSRVLAAEAALRYLHPRTSLVRHTPRGPRRNWASFAASSYMSYALLRFARAAASPWARGLGVRIARALVRRQGPQGQWGWLYHVPSGTVADLYPVYSVHQHAMAPFFLLEAMGQGCPEFRAPLVRGFQWVLGSNEQGTPMVDADRELIWRCVEPATVFRGGGPAAASSGAGTSTIHRGAGRLARFARAAGSVLAGRSAGAASPAQLEVNRECRSYELAWGLWAFAGRGEFAEILDHPAFGTAAAA